MKEISIIIIVDRMNATAFEMTRSDHTVHVDSCPLANQITADSRFGDHTEFRRRLELMGGCKFFKEDINVKYL